MKISVPLRTGGGRRIGFHEVPAVFARRAADHPAELAQPVLLHNIGQGDRKIWQIVDIWLASAPFAALIHNADIIGEAAQLTEATELRLWHDQIQYKVAETGGVNMWHQDWPYWGVLDAPHQLTAWVALDDVTVENGCMSMVPGSHRWGNQIDHLHTLKSYDDLPATFQGRAIERRHCPVAKGEVHYHHALTWHGSHANTSGRPRRAIALHYMTEQTRYRAGSIHPLKPRITVADGAKLEGDVFPLVWQRG